jgi:hypothetical protein
VRLLRPALTTTAAYARLRLRRLSSATHPLLLLLLLLLLLVVVALLLCSSAVSFRRALLPKLLGSMMMRLTTLTTTDAAARTVALSPAPARHPRAPVLLASPPLLQRLMMCRRPYVHRRPRILLVLSHCSESPQAVLVAVDCCHHGCSGWGTAAPHAADAAAAGDDDGDNHSQLLSPPHLYRQQSPPPLHDARVPSAH